MFQKMHTGLCGPKLMDQLDSNICTCCSVAEGRSTAFSVKLQSAGRHDVGAVTQEGCPTTEVHSCKSLATIHEGFLREVC